MSDTDSSSSPPSVSISSHFPAQYLELLNGLPLPERYLIKGASGRPAVDDLTISEISIPTQTADQTSENYDDDDTDLDASDLEDEVSDANGTLKGSEEGSQESVYWKDKQGEGFGAKKKDGEGFGAKDKHEGFGAKDKRGEGFIVKDNNLRASSEGFDVKRLTDNHGLGLDVRTKNVEDILKFGTGRYSRHYPSVEPERLSADRDSKEKKVRFEERNSQERNLQNDRRYNAERHERGSTRRGSADKQLQERESVERQLQERGSLERQTKSVDRDLATGRQPKYIDTLQSSGRLESSSSKRQNIVGSSSERDNVETKNLLKQTIGNKTNSSSNSSQRQNSETKTSQHQNEDSNNSQSLNTTTPQRLNAETIERPNPSVRHSSSSPDLFTEGFKLQRKIRPRPPQPRIVAGETKGTRSQNKLQGIKETLPNKANISYGAPHKESIPTAHVIPSPAAVPPTSSSTTNQHWNIRGTGSTTHFEALPEDPDATANYSTYPGASSANIKSHADSPTKNWRGGSGGGASGNGSVGNFKALREEADLTYNTSPPFVIEDLEQDRGMVDGYRGGAGNTMRWDSTTTSQQQQQGYNSQQFHSHQSHHLQSQQPPPVLGLASTLPTSSSMSSTMPPPHSQRGYDYPYTQSLSSTQPQLRQYSHPQQQAGRTTPAGSIYMPANYSSSWRGGGGGGGGERVVAGGGGGGAGGGGVVDEVTQWQQRHQEQLRRQQMEYTDPLSGVVGAGPSLLSSSGGHYDPHRLDSVRQAADDIIKEKDTIIDRQKMAILQLEKQGKASEADMTRAMLKKTQEEVDLLRRKLQYETAEEEAYRNSRLKSRITELCTGGNEAQQSLERKLGEVEFTLQQMKITKDCEMQDKNQQILRLETKINELERSVSAWQDRCAEAQKSCSQLQEKKASLERYLQDMPTQDERSGTKAKLAAMEHELELERSRVTELEEHLNETRRTLGARDALVGTLEKCNSEKEELILKLQDETGALSIALEKLRGEGPPPEDDMEELQYKNIRLQADLDKARKLLETHERRQRESMRRRETDTRQVRERLEQEEANVHALRAELATKHTDLKKVILSNKKLSQQKQELHEHVIALESQVSSLSVSDEAQAGKEEMRLQERRLMAEMNLCCTELNNLVNLCVQHSKGETLDMSTLLAAGESVSVSDLTGDAASAENLQSLKYRISKVREQRDQLDNLRATLANQYAEELGDKVTCTHQ